MCSTGFTKILFQSNSYLIGRTERSEQSFGDEKILSAHTWLVTKIYRKKSSAYNGAKESMLAAKDYLKYKISTQVVEVKRKQCNAMQFHQNKLPLLWWKRNKFCSHTKLWPRLKIRTTMHYRK